MYAMFDVCPFPKLRNLDFDTDPTKGVNHINPGLFETCQTGGGEA